MFMAVWSSLHHPSTPSSNIFLLLFEQKVGDRLMNLDQQSAIRNYYIEQT